MFKKDAPATVYKEKDEALSKLILSGDIGSFSEAEKVMYYKYMCDRVGLDWTTKPFDYLTLGGKKVLYLSKGGAEQLNKVHNISMSIADTKKIDDMYVVTARAEVPGLISDAGGLGALKHTA